MKTIHDFESYNAYLGLAKPLDKDIDLGFYNAPVMLSKSDPIVVDFYRISVKINVIYKHSSNAQPTTAVYFNSPNLPVPAGWDVEPTYTGMYLQLSKKIIEENRHLFRTYLDYGQHEALFLNDTEVEEIHTVFKLMMKYYTPEKKQFGLLLSYINVVLSLVEEWYKRQFSTDPKRYNPIVTAFQQHLWQYYDTPANQLPSVQFFADKLGLSPNYLGDIIKHFSQKSALETIHEFVLLKAKEMLEHRADLNTSAIAYALGFEYPNYFAKFFKKQTTLTPTTYRLIATQQRPS